MKPVDASLALQAARFKLLADYMPAWIALYEARTQTCQYANRGYAEAFGLTEESILGKSFAEIIGAEAAARHYFRIGAGGLNTSQAAQLAVMLPAPKRFEKRPGSAYVVGRAATVAARMGAVELP